jgi:hypothetical protein
MGSVQGAGVEIGIAVACPVFPVAGIGWHPVNRLIKTRKRHKSDRFFIALTRKDDRIKMIFLPIIIRIFPWNLSTFLMNFIPPHRVA